MSAWLAQLTAEEVERAFGIGVCLLVVGGCAIAWWAMRGQP